MILSMTSIISRVGGVAIVGGLLHQSLPVIWIVLASDLFAWYADVDEICDGEVETHSGLNACIDIYTRGIHPSVDVPDGFFAAYRSRMTALCHACKVL